MAGHAKDTTATIIPGMHYRDAPAAVERLCAAFGFEKGLVVPGPNGTIAHAQLKFGNGMVMLGSAVEDNFGQMVKVPDGPDGKVTQSAYVVVEDADAHYAMAAAGGAKIEIDIHDEDYGGRGYSARDREGHLRYFGTYDPWA